VWASCPWLPSHRIPVVLWLSSCLGYGVVLFTLSGVGLLGLLLVSLILGIFFQEGLVARQVGSLREVTLRDLPVVMVRGKFIVQGLLCNGGDAAASAPPCRFALCASLAFFLFSFSAVVVAFSSAAAFPAAAATATARAFCLFLFASVDAAASCALAAAFAASAALFASVAASAVAASSAASRVAVSVAALAAASVAAAPRLPPLLPLLPGGL